MMELKQLLEKHGITDSGIISEFQDCIASAVTLKTGNAIPKSRFDEVLTQKKEANARISELELELKTNIEKLETLQPQLAVIEELKGKVEIYDQQRIAQWENIINGLDDKQKLIFEELPDVESKFNEYNRLVKFDLLGGSHVPPDGTPPAAGATPTDIEKDFYSQYE